MKFNGSFLKQSNEFTYTHKTIVNIYIVYELGASTSNDNDPTLKNCLYGAVTLTKNADIDKCGYSCYEIGFDKEKDILVLEKGPIHRLEHTLTGKKMYSINFTVTRKKFCLSLHYNGTNSYLFVNGTEIYKFKAKDSGIVASPLCLGNI